jgi:hypothetical protein
VSLGAILLAAAALLICLPTAFRNATAAALFLCWLLGIVLEYGFAYYLSKPEMFYCDLFVIAVIMAKPEVCDMRPYSGFWHQVKCTMLERNKWDRRVIALFALAWIVYTLPLSDAMFWWSLFAVTILQYLCVATEALTKLRTATMKRNLLEITPPSGLEFAVRSTSGGR